MDNIEVITLLKLIKHAVINGSVSLILGSLVFGFTANYEQALAIKLLTTHIFNDNRCLSILNLPSLLGF